MDLKNSGNIVLVIGKTIGHLEQSIFARQGVEFENRIFEHLNDLYPEKIFKFSRYDQYDEAIEYILKKDNTPFLTIDLTNRHEPKPDNRSR